MYTLGLLLTWAGLIVLTFVKGKEWGIVDDNEGKIMCSFACVLPALLWPATLFFLAFVGLGFWAEGKYQEHKDGQ